MPLIKLPSICQWNKQQLLWHSSIKIYLKLISVHAIYMYIEREKNIILDLMSTFMDFIVKYVEFWSHFYFSFCWAWHLFCFDAHTYAHSHKRTKWRVIILIGYWYDLASSFTDDKPRSKWLSQTCFSSVIAPNLHCIYIVNNGLNRRKKSSAGFCFVIFLTFSKISTLILSYDYMVYDATVNSNFFEWSAVVVVRI